MDIRLVLIRCAQFFAVLSVACALNKGFKQGPGMTSDEIIRARGYKTELVHVVSEDGYRLQLTHAWNPLLEEMDLENKPPILFLHGITAESNCFVMNSFDAKPRDFSKLDLSDKRIAKKIARDPSAKSLALLAMNFGHEVWLLNRRGTPGSQTKANGQKAKIFRQQDDSQLQSNDSTKMVTHGLLKLFKHKAKLLELFALSADPVFWNYSIDEQAEYDFPVVLKHVSEHSESNVMVVGHSEGGAIIMMALSEKPELAESISGAILWSPAPNIGHANDEYVYKLLPFEPLFEKFIGPFPPAFSMRLIQIGFAKLCATKKARRTTCKSLLDGFFGDGKYNEPFLPEFAGAAFITCSTHEAAHFIQTISKFGGSMHKFDFGDKSINQAKYNQSEPPMYDFSRITLDKISFYAGRTDYLVTTQSMQYTASKLSVPYKFHFIDDYFSHGGYFLHNNTAKLSIIPSMQEIQLFSAS